MAPLVTISPGYRVPPVTRPRGCHVPVVAGLSAGSAQCPHGGLEGRCARGALTVVEPVPEAVESVLDEVFCGAEVEPRIDCTPVSPRRRGIRLASLHSWMMLSKRITENRRLATAAPAIRHRMMTRSRPRVFRPLTCFTNLSVSDSATAMVEGIGG
jgi:hypothetical protein